MFRLILLLSAFAVVSFGQSSEEPPTTIDPATKLLCKSDISEECPSGWESFKGHCYKIFETQKTWDEAEAACESEESHLASIFDDDENTFITGLGNNVSSNSANLQCQGIRTDLHNQVWIGLSNQTNHTYSTWTDGNERQYTHWRPNEPNNLGGNEACIHIAIADGCDSHSFWNDLPCEKQLKFVCKKKNVVLESPVITKPDSQFEECPAGWNDFSNNCYKIFETQHTWNEAEAVCESGGSHLTSILNEQENNFITELGNNASSDSANLKCQGIRNDLHNQVWIGLSNQTNHTYSTWTDGNERQYTHWRPNEPNNLGGNEACMHIAIADGCDSHSFWNDLPCEKQLKFVCKKQKALAKTPINHVPHKSGDALQCQIGWDQFQDNCYKIHETQKNWDEAEAACESEESHLASIFDDEENAFITGLGNNASSDSANLQCQGIRTDLHNQVWIGLSNQTNHTYSTWTDGNERQYTHWRPNEPNNLGGNEACMHIAIADGCDSHSFWNDLPCEKQLKFVCKKKATEPLNDKQIDCGASLNYS